MKRVLLLFLILNSFEISAGESSLNFEFLNCSKNIHVSYSKTIKLELFKEDSLIKTLRTNTVYGNSFEGLTNGNYTLQYKAHNGKVKTRKVAVDSSKTYLISICFDSITHDNTNSFIPFINQLKSGETFTINFSSFGCAHSYKQKIDFYKKGCGSDLIIVKYKSQSQKVSHFGKKQIAKFEKELVLTNFKNNSTTTRSYELNYNGNSIKIVESSNFRSRGYFDLLKSLNLKWKL